MSAQGWLVARKEGKQALYRVTERGRRRIEGLSPRIYGPVVEWDGRWRMLTYTIPESERKHRDRLRKELTVIGWAPLSAAMWITPADALDAAREIAQSAGMLDRVDLFVGEYRGSLSDRELLRKCWDLDAIATAYRRFITAYEPRLARERAHHAFTDEAAFVERLWLVHDFRKFTYVDPGLPSTLLPAHWPGTLAAALFREYYAAIDRKSLRFFEATARAAVRSA